MSKTGELVTNDMNNKKGKLIGLFNLEPHIHNIALMKISQYYKDMGYTVEWYDHLKHKKYHKIFAASLFDFTDKGMVTDDMITGGSGFDVASKLPTEIEEHCHPQGGRQYSLADYSLFPKCNTSYVWFSRGCIRNCPFCIVRRKEGKIHPTWELYLNKKSKYIDVMDNNFFANPEWREAMKKLRHWDKGVNFHGVDVRILTDEMIEALWSVKLYKSVKIAWDNPKDDLEPNLTKLRKHVGSSGISKFMCYVLIGYWSTPEEDLHRVETLRKLGINPYVMPFNKFDTYQKTFKNYVNGKRHFHGCSWEEFKKSEKYEKEVNRDKHIEEKRKTHKPLSEF